MLDVVNVVAGYETSRVLNGISLNVRAGEVVALFGRNGVGKTTTLKTIMGWLSPTSGDIRLDGRSIAGWSPDRICRAGIGFIPEDRRVFPTLSVEENLCLGGFQAPRRPRSETQRLLEEIYGQFPRLAERRRQAGNTLSGGEQQMLVIGRALMGAPRLLLIDEPSEGLAPKIVREVFDAVRSIAARGIAILLVEQHVKQAADIIDRIYVVEKGTIAVETELDGDGTETELMKWLAV